ncbi:class I SAM-dependent methyltransferase [Pseudaestuariivita sp.]|uniref:class I SAM-dependent methyltransferase n=1 Tax=Pseudaestuariivita sp. TaxID=2211669 RepID=UPI00405908F6
MSLKDKLLRQIAADGPMPLNRYMAACLGDPEHGYYATRQPLGQDFVTAPEVSQMFGELLALVLAQAWTEQGTLKRILLAELGPGRGTLMADMLRVIRHVPGMAEAVEVHLVETSPVLRAEQKTRLPEATWHDSVESLPEGPLYLVANEFFDALPIRQFQRTDDAWREVHVGANGDALAFGLGAPAPIAALAHRLEDSRPGDIVETCAPAMAITEQVADRIAQHGGGALYIDYGDWRSVGDTFQAVKAHKPVDPLKAPGKADLTAHVDFEPLAEAAKAQGLWHSRLTPQGIFLERLGITQRAQALAKGMDEDALQTHIAAHRRLIHPEEMGTLFKVLSFAQEPMPGFADD